MTDQLSFELRHSDGDPIGVDQQKDTKRPEEKLSHTLGTRGPDSAPASGDEAEAIVRQHWASPAHSVTDIAQMMGRGKYYVHEIANRLGLERPKPYEIRARNARLNRELGIPEKTLAKLRAVKRDNAAEEAQRAADEAHDRAVAAFYKTHGPYTDHAKALPPQPFMPIGWEPRPVAERLRKSMVGCAAAMAAGIAR